MGYYYDQYLKNVTWSRAESNDNTISCTVVVSVSISYSRCFNPTFSSCTVTHLPYGLCTISSLTTSIYSIDNLLYPYALSAISSPYFFSSLCLSTYILPSMYTISSSSHNNPSFFFNAWITSYSLVLFLLISFIISKSSVIAVLLNIITSTVILLVHSSSLSNWTSLLSTFVFTWFFLDKMSTFVFVFPEIYHRVKS